ncbi:MAG: hypothetical protein WC648_01115 [Candidatus Paceibacterota bacterium]
MTNEALKNGFLATLADDEQGGIWVYCNEKDPNRKGFLLKCCKGCKHNPYELTR